MPTPIVTASRAASAKRALTRVTASQANPLRLNGSRVGVCDRRAVTIATERGDGPARRGSAIPSSRCPRRSPPPTKTCCATCSSTARTKTDRTGTGTRSVFGRQLRFDLSQGFPLITTKRVHFASIAYELLWFLRGESQRRRGCTITASRSGTNGRMPRASSAPSTACSGGRGRRRRARRSTRSRRCVEQIRTNPDSRRLIVSAWNVADIPDMALAPVPRALPVLRRRRQAVLPALPAQRRPVPRRAVQHRLATRC